MKRIFIVLLLVVGLAVVQSCSDYVQSVDPRQDLIQDAALNDPTQIPFLVQGVQRQFVRIYAQTNTLSGGLSDELIFDNRVPNATFPTFQDLDNGLPLLDNNSVNNNWAVMGQAYFTAQNLLDRVGKINFGSNAASKNTALFNAYLYGGLVRYMYAAYYGLKEQQGGGVINGGPFIPSANLTDSALNYLNQALAVAANDLQRRQVNTVIAKVNLADARYAAARTAAQNGLKSGDGALSALYEQATIANQWYFDAGLGRSQYVPASRYADYIAADKDEGIVIAGTVAGGAFSVPGNTEADLQNFANTRRIVLYGPFTSSGFKYHLQGKYPNQGSPAPVVTWQENSLILAETALRVSNSESEALTNVNAVRSFYKLTTRTTTNLDSVYIERDKTLFGMGQRLIDQRRFNKWHLGATTWRYMPIGLPERQTNPNLQGN